MRENKLLDELDHALGMVVLGALNSIPRNYGYIKTIEFLRGKKTDFIIKNKLNENEFYGCLSEFSKDLLEAVMEDLHMRGLIETEEMGKFHRPVLLISKDGLRLLGGLENVKLRSGVFSKKDLKLLNEDLYYKLRELRFKLAKKDGLPAYCICTNDSLVEMSNRKSQSTDELLMIKGIGPKFIEKYSRDFLSVLRTG